MHHFIQPLYSVKSDNTVRMLSAHIWLEGHATNLYYTASKEPYRGTVACLCLRAMSLGRKL